MSDRPSVFLRAFSILLTPLLFIVAGVLYAMFVVDVNTPRSPLRQSRLISFTGMDAPVVGAVFVRQRGEIPSGFGFSIAPGQLPSAFELQTLKDTLRQRFGTLLPIQVQRVEELESNPGPCAAISASDLASGALLRALRLEAATACLVTSKRPLERRAIIVVVAMSGESWRRFVTKRLCRAVSEAALRAFAPRPDYAVCVPVDRTAADRKLPAYVHEIRSDGTLAWIRGY